MGIKERTDGYVGLQICSNYPRLPLALSIQQKFRFEISEIPRAQWNGTFRLHRPVPSHHAFCYCSSTQDTKERYLGQQLCQMEKGHLGPTNRNERTGQSRQRSKMVPKYSNSGRIEPKWSVPFNF